MNLSYPFTREAADGERTRHLLELTVECLRPDRSTGDTWGRVVLTEVQERDSATGHWVDFDLTDDEWAAIEDDVQ